MAETGSGKRWLLYGCFGCLGLAGLVVLAVGGVTGVAYFKAQSEEIEQRTLTRALDPPPPPAEPLVESGAATPAEVAGVVVLDLSQADFRVLPADSGEPLRVEASYDGASYELRESYAPGAETGWRYDLSFHRTAPSLVTALKELFSGNRPEVHVYLPREVPFDLDVRFADGGAEVDLGGLWIGSANVEVEKGGFALDVSRPLQAPMERLTVNGRMGGFSLESIGHASPALVEVDFRMGGMSLDLQGEWRQDARIAVRSRMAGGYVRLPDEANVVGLDPSLVDLPGEPDPDRPTLTFFDTDQLGEIEFGY